MLTINNQNLAALQQVHAAQMHAAQSVIVAMSAQEQIVHVAALAASKHCLSKKKPQHLLRLFFNHSY